jgi:hypothetical protein
MGEPSKYIKVDGTRDLTGKEFALVVANALKSGYEKERASGFAKFLSVLLTFATAIVAMILAPVTAGASLFAYLSANALTISLVFAAGIALQFGLSALWTHLGKFGNAIFTNKMMTFLGNIASFISFTTAMFGNYSAIVKGFTSTAVKMTSSEIFNYAVKILNSTLSVINKIMTFTASSHSTKDEDDEVKTMDDISSQKQMDLVQYYFESYQWAEVNSISDNAPYVLTQGTIDNATRKYY